MHLSASQMLLIKGLPKNWGEYKKVCVMGGKCYQVPIWYIVLHGLKAATLPTLGFPEIPY